MRQLDFTKEKVQTLTLDELEQTYHENLVTGEPVGGVYHFELIHKLFDTFEQAGLRPEVQEIFAADNRDALRPGVSKLPAIEERDGKNALTAHVLRRVYANIALRADEDDEMVTNLAVAYHQRGVQVGIGPMVHVCHNQCILGAEDVVATYSCFGRGRMSRSESSLQYVYDRADVWAHRFETDSARRREEIGRLKEQPLKGRVRSLLGMLLELRVRYDHFDRSLRTGEVIYPLNSSQLGEAAASILSTAEGKKGEGKEPTMWDAYNDCNYTLKPNRADIPSVLPQQLVLYQSFMRYLRELYGNE